MKKTVKPYMLNEEPFSVWNCVGAILLCLLIVIAALNFRFLWEIYGVEVSGESMEDTLNDEDFLYASRISVPERGDIVIINVEKYRETYHFSGDNLIKRLIGVEGDVIRITEGKVYRRLAGETEFVQLEEDYAKGATYTAADPFEVTVGKGEIFFLGDNRKNSTDSREVGCLRLGDVVGVVTEWSLENRPHTRWEVFVEWLKDLI